MLRDESGVLFPRPGGGSPETGPTITTRYTTTTRRTGPVLGIATTTIQDHAIPVATGAAAGAAGTATDTGGTAITTGTTGRAITTATTARRLLYTTPATPTAPPATCSGTTITAIHAPTTTTTPTSG